MCEGKMVPTFPLHQIDLWRPRVCSIQPERRPRTTRRRGLELRLDVESGALGNGERRC